jgi:hypothetical protein
MAYRPSPLQRIRGLLRDNPTLAVALPEAERLRELNRRFAGVVPAAVARACRVAAIQPVVAVKVKVRAEWTLPEKREKAGMGAAALNAFRDLDAHLPDGDLKAAVDALLARRRG